MKKAVIYYKYCEKTVDRELSQELRALATERYFDSLGETSRPSFCKEEGGKPCFSDERYHFSVSHSGRLYCIMFYSERCGLDIELLPRKAERSEALAERFFSQNEKAYYYAEGAGDELFIRLWTAKEALVKLTGAGLSGIAKTDFTQGGYIALPDGLIPHNAVGAVAAESLPDSITACEL